MKKEKCGCGKASYKIGLCKEHLEHAKKLVIARLETMPDDVRLHIG